MLIQNGELVTGTLCKKTLGTSGGSLIHVIWMEEGPEAARAFLSQTQYTVNHWLLQHGFSIGIGDTVADVKTMNIISDTIAEVRGGLVACKAPPCLCDSRQKEDLVKSSMHACPLWHAAQSRREEVRAGGLLLHPQGCTLCLPQMGLLADSCLRGNFPCLEVLGACLMRQPLRCAGQEQGEEADGEAAEPRPGVAARAHPHGVLRVPGALFFHQGGLAWCMHAHTLDQDLVCSLGACASNRQAKGKHASTWPRVASQLASGVE